MKKRVLLGMSGGVDSSTAALLLKKQGYEVIGITLKFFEKEMNREDNSFSDNSDAKKVCDSLGIPHYKFDYSKEFKENVVDDFVNCYENCKTPNPCIECNKYLKFGVMWQKAKELECDYLATGHYAKQEYSQKYKQYVLRKSEETKKDQTYFLYSIQKDILPNLIFPLSEYKEKSEIREIAKQNELKVAEKSDSQEVCFIPDNDYGNFLKKNSNTKVKSGNIVLSNGEILGRHRGLIYYTIGQRKGLGIAYKEPLYVISLNKEKNEVIVGIEKELYKNKLYTNSLNFLVDFDKWEEDIYAKIRYRAKEAKAKVIEAGEKLEVIFEEPQRAITKGQSVVFYDKEGIVLRWRKDNLRKEINKCQKQ